ncbi:MAG: hypothetical protein R3B93_17815 [Bacteroidia bacterium]
MNTKYTLVALIFSLFALITTAQDYQQCERDYSNLQQAVKTLPEEVVPGSEIFLSEAYLQSIEDGYFKGIPSGMKHWNYVRPASRKELRNENESSSELMGNDGNIYGLITTPSNVHFFRPTEVFEGEYLPQWKDPEMIIPLGLMPVNILQYHNRLFVVKEKRDEYIVLEVGGNTLVFYPGLPKTELVFDSEKVLNRIAEKQNIASTLLGGQFIVTNSANLHYRTRSVGLDHSLDASIDRLTIKVKDVVANRRETLLAYGEEETFYLVIDEESDFVLLEKGCVMDQQREVALRAQQEAPKAQENLNELLEKEFSQAELESKVWLMQVLQGRFQLKSNGKSGEGTYEYIFIDEKEDFVTCLKPQLDENGELGLLSCYTSEKGLYHTKIEVSIDGEEPIVSRRIPTLNEKSSRKRNDGQIVELIHFTDGDDMGIIKAIAQNADKPIMVSYVAGGSFFEEVELDIVYKEAIRDAYLYSIFLKK